MADKKPDVIVPAHKCEVAGCIAHKETTFKSKVTGGSEDKSSYKARVHFTEMEAMLVPATESVKRILQQKYARKGEFPQGRIVDVTSKGDFAQTESDVMEQLAKLTPEQQASKFAEIMRQAELVQRAMNNHTR